jgi:hypothetical protein
MTEKEDDEKDSRPDDARWRPMTEDLGVVPKTLALFRRPSRSPMSADGF